MGKGGKSRMFKGASAGTSMGKGGQSRMSKGAAGNLFFFRSEAPPNLSARAKKNSEGRSGLFFIEKSFFFIQKSMYLLLSV